MDQLLSEIRRSTVKSHLLHIYAKLGIGNRSELTAEVIRRSGGGGIGRA